MRTLSQTTEPVDFRPGAAPLIPLLLAVAAVAVPWLLTHGLPLLGFALSRGFAVICHQRPERSFWVFGAPVAVCARCLGVYVGTACGLLMKASRSVALRLLVIVTALNLLDAAAEVAGLHGNWMAARFGLGLGVGAAAGLLLSSVMAEEKALRRFRALFSR